MKGLLLVVILVAYGSALMAASERTLAFYEVKPVTTPPTIDGQLTDPCWQTANQATVYYQYFKPDPKPGVLKTEFRMLYDKKGLYLGIINYDDQVDKIRARFTTRDVPELWMDDCAEIYFDATAQGVGYAKFVVNPLGTQGDSKRIDAAVSLPDWSGHSWHAKTSRRKDAWIIEAHFPWSDLGREAAAGDLWLFDHVRYAYSTGKFRGVTWSPGGNYQSPENFGWLYFGEARGLSVERVGKVLAHTVTPPWRLMAADGFLVCSTRDRADFVKAAPLVEQEEKTLAGMLQKTAAIATKALSEKVTKLREQAEHMRIEKDTPLAASESIKKLKALQQEVNKVYWEARIEKLLQEI